MFYKVWSLLGPLYIKSKKCVVARLDNLCADSSLGWHLVNGKLCCFIHPKNANLKTYIQERILICINYILFHIHSLGWLPLAEVRIGDQSHYQPSQSAWSRRSGRKLNELLTVIIELSVHLLGRFYSNLWWVFRRGHTETSWKALACWGWWRRWFNAMFRMLVRVVMEVMMGVVMKMRWLCG